ncbi:hypothetical protein MMYC01_208391, partial [Madurella mycetomatis]
FDLDLDSIGCTNAQLIGVYPRAYHLLNGASITITDKKRSKMVTLSPQQAHSLVTAFFHDMVNTAMGRVRDFTTHANVHKAVARSSQVACETKVPDALHNIYTDLSNVASG